MAKVVLQPCAGRSAPENYEATIRRPVPLATLGRHLGAADMQTLTALYPGGVVPTWGVTPGGPNPGKWRRLASDDIVLFSGQGKIFASAVVRHKVVSRALALDLWKPDEEGRAFEYLYFVDDVRERNIPYAALNEAAGYAPTNVVQAFQVLPEGQSEAILTALSLTPRVSVAQYNAALKELANLDRKAEVLVRTEQGFLRNTLFGNSVAGECAICGRSLPVGLLVAAHIKKRAECSETEKADYQHNVVPMCVFGCDGLFERGYIVVVDGAVAVGQARRADLTPAVATYLKTIEGRPVPAWATCSQYFDWHYQHHEQDFA